jgi:hypothetical protein
MLVAQTGLLTGSRPFRGDNAYDLMHAIMTMSAAPPSFLRPEIPSAFDAIVLRACEAARIS